MINVTCTRSILFVLHLLFYLRKYKKDTSSVTHLRQYTLKTNYKAQRIVQIFIREV